MWTTPTIMSWQIGNEPRAFSDENKEPFARWMADVAAQIKSLDPNHMVSSGSEGAWGCEMDMNLFEKIHADSNINYLNIHIGPTTGLGEGGQPEGTSSVCQGKY